MKELSGEQLDRIARRLDGSDETLRPDEQVLADELADLERAMAGRLDAAAPPEALARVRRRMLAETAGPRRTLRLKFIAPLAVAAAAVLAVGVAVWMRATGTTPPATDKEPIAQTSPGADSPLGAGQLAEVSEALRRPDHNADLDMLAHEMDELGADAVAAATPDDAELDALEWDIEELLIDYPPAGPTGM